MGLQYKVRSSSTLERWYELRFEEVNGPEQTEIRGTFLPPEWFPQSGVQLTWPHAGTDWCYMLEEVRTATCGWLTKSPRANLY